LARILPKFCANLFQFLQQIIYSEDFLAQHKRSPQDFIRNRCLHFPTLILYLTNFLKSSIQTELDSFFQLLQNASIPVRTVTKSAFTQARAKLRYQAFAELNQHCIQFFTSHFPLRTWHGFRLLAMDASILTLPLNPETIAHFDDLPTRSHHTRPQAMASQLYDLLNRVTLHASLASAQSDERHLAYSHSTFFPANSLVLLDRGYPAFWVFSWLLANHTHFCARVSVESWAEVKTFAQSHQQEQLITLHPTHPSKEKCGLYQLPLTPIPVRLIRVTTENGEEQFLMTSLLDADAFPHACFGDLYHQRWGIEENFKHMKSRIEIENFTGKSVHSIYQDFHARIFAMNLTAVLVHTAQDLVAKDTQEKTHAYQVNFTYAISCMKNTVLNLLQHADPWLICSQLILLFQKTLEPVRPNRRFRRHKIRRDKRLHFTCYKRTA